MSEENRVHGGEYDHFHYVIASKVFGLELGDLRRIVAATEHLPDAAEITVEDVSKSFVRVDEYTVRKIHVRKTNKK